MQSKVSETEWVSIEWMQRAHDALTRMLDGPPELKRQMIQFLLDSGLWSEDVSWDSAVNRFNANLNPTRPQYFKLSEMWALMKRFEVYDLFYAMADDLGFEVRIVATETRRLAKLHRIAQALEENNRIARDAVELMQLIGKGGAVMRINPAIRDRSSSFRFVEHDGKEETRDAPSVTGGTF